eukprot:TRINITY_DN13066_c0_g1_i1.p1 TRINITY_DN13066_c0_g1~~TRINITY_DN13066_c0_g1_i1.p1  ORF type:complete len:731 (+),score=122.44 TRINITY_DN13066_c0_g1_i1:31-2223(+)
MSKELSKKKWEKRRNYKNRHKQEVKHLSLTFYPTSSSTLSSDSDSDDDIHQKYNALLTKYHHLKQELLDLKLGSTNDTSSPTQSTPTSMTRTSSLKWSSDKTKKTSLSSPHQHDLRRKVPYSNPIPERKKDHTKLIRSYPVMSTSGEMMRIGRDTFADEIEPEYSSTSSYSEDFDINGMDDNGVTPLINSIEMNDIKLFESVVNNPECDVNLTDEMGRYPLLCALQEKNIKMIKKLLEKGANINCSDDAGNTLLHRCIIDNDLKPLAHDLLMNYNVDVQAKNKQQNNPLIIAIHEEDDHIVRMLLQRGADPNIKCDTVFPIHAAADTDNLDIVKILVDFGADINIVDSLGNSPLHIASKRGSLEIVEYLLGAKVDTRITNNLFLKAFDMTSNERIRKLIEDWDPSTKSWKWEFDSTNLAIYPQRKLGQGAYGAVYKGRLFSTPVAVKSLKDLSSAAQEAFNNEVGLMVDIMHPNILILMGTCYSAEWGRCIVTEFIDGGSLSAYIQKHHPLPLMKVLKCGIDTSRGIAWLHSRNPTILHRDLHTNNILITKTGTCKVCDFGLSQVQGSFREINRIYKRIRPPEIETGDKTYTKASDVFMLGLILFELLTRQKGTIKKTLPQSLDILTEKNLHNESMDPDLDTESYRNTVRTYIDIVRSTVEHDPLKRPPIEEVVLLLESLQEEIDPEVPEKYSFLSDDFHSFEIMNRRQTEFHNQVGFDVEDCYYLEDSS